MARRTLIVLTGTVFGLTVAAASWHFIKPKPVITGERADAIQVGMTKAEVIALVGGPPGDYAPGEIITYVRGCVGADSSGFYEGTNWWGREGMIQVQFNEQGLVDSVGFYPAHVSYRTGTWSNLRAMLPYGGQTQRHEWVPGCW